VHPKQPSTGRYSTGFIIEAGLAGPANSLYLVVDSFEIKKAEGLQSVFGVWISLKPSAIFL
jgi:hypothetical protein